MPLRIFVAIAVVALVAFALAVWNMGSDPARPRAADPAPPEAQLEPPGPSAPPGRAGRDPGVTWEVPPGWTVDAAHGMRLATYLVRGARGGDPAECAVYHFGPGQGGGVEANLERWKGEFEPLERHAVHALEPGGIPVTRIVARGTYAAHSMRGAEPGGERPKWALVGAVVQGPGGDLFFKLVGPARVVDAAAADFDRMLGSLRKK